MEEDRLGSVRLLLETLLSYLPNELRSCVQAPAGTAPSKNHPCTACGGRGVVRLQRGTRLCAACEGHGWRRRRPGEPHFDEFTREEIGTEEKAVRCATGWEIDASLSRLASDEAERNGYTREAAWVQKKNSLYRHGDYALLERAVARAREEQPRPVKAAWQILALSYDATLIADRAMVEQGVEAIAVFMPERPRVPGWLLPDPYAHKKSLWHGRAPQHDLRRGQRNEEIRQLRAQGMSPTKIAQRHGLARRTVERVLAASATLPTERSDIGARL